MEEKARLQTARAIIAPATAATRVHAAIRRQWSINKSETAHVSNGVDAGCLAFVGFMVSLWALSTKEIWTRTGPKGSLLQGGVFSYPS